MKAVLLVGTGVCLGVFLYCGIAAGVPHPFIVVLSLAFLAVRSF
jgi:hypothetical protein